MTTRSTARRRADTIRGSEDDFDDPGVVDVVGSELAFEAQENDDETATKTT